MDEFGAWILKWSVIGFGWFIAKRVGWAVWNWYDYHFPADEDLPPEDLDLRFP